MSSKIEFLNFNKRKRYSRRPRLSDTRYLAKRECMIAHHTKTPASVHSFLSNPIELANYLLLVGYIFLINKKTKNINTTKLKN